MLRRILFLAVALVPLTFASAQQGQGEFTVEKDVTYAKVGDQELQLDIAVPKGEGPFPAVVCIHGGGWKAGKRQDVAKLTELLAKNGFVAATVSYRFSQVAKFPAQIHDVKAAVRFLRANADKYKIDPERMGAVGFSAGGHLASLLGSADKGDGLEGDGGNPDQSSRVQAVVNFFGPTDFLVKRWEPSVETAFLAPLIGDSFENDRPGYAKASPLKYVSKDDPPFLFIHGDMDPLVGLHHSVDMAKALKEVGVPAEVMVMKGEGHGWGGQKLQDTLDRTVKFFQEKLQK